MLHENQDSNCFFVTYCHVTVICTILKIAIKKKIVRDMPKMSWTTIKLAGHVRMTTSMTDIMLDTDNGRRTQTMLSQANPADIVRVQHCLQVCNYTALIITSKLDSCFIIIFIYIIYE